MRAYSLDLRVRVPADLDAGATARAVAAKYTVSESWARRLRQTRRETGRVAPAARRHGPPPAWAADADRLRRAVAEPPTPPWPSNACGVTSGTAAPPRATPSGRSGWSARKSVRAAEQDRPDVAARRTAWRAEQPGLDPARRVSLDETGANTAVTRTHGRCRWGDRPVTPVPSARRTTTLVAALRADGTAAPTVVDGATDRAAFEAYVAQQLVPALRPGDVVLTDSLPAHTGPPGADAGGGGRGRGPVWAAVQPGPEPDREGAEQAEGPAAGGGRADGRGAEARIGRLVDEFRPEECRNYFRSCGYSSDTPTPEPL